jgi:hypothetical protein
MGPNTGFEVNVRGVRTALIGMIPLCGSAYLIMPSVTLFSVPSRVAGD